MPGRTPPGRPILAFDTAAAHCAAAALSGGRILATRDEPMIKGQAERLMPLLDEVLAEAGLGWSDLSAIGVGTGPGSFTGVRVAVAAARGLALGLGIPALGVDLFEAGAWQAPRPCRVLVARRGGEVAWQDFGADGPEGPAQCCPPGGQMPPGPPVAGAAGPVAVTIARIAAARAGTKWPRPAPLYLRAADALPARDTGPAILAG